MDPIIVYEDSDLLVLNKPAGWIVNEAKTTGKNPVVQTWIKEHFRFPIFEHHECRNGIVHRLDKETSGALVVAKTKQAFENLQQQFKERLIKKTYLALVHGKVELESGSINAPVGRLPWNRERFGILPGGRNASTTYTSISYYQSPSTKEEFTLLELKPKTGRTHQIRIHLKHIGHPIISDSFYAGRKTARKDRLWCPRLFLHASEIIFTHPKNNEEVFVKANLSQDLQKVLELLTKS
jgi:23S rRNA pseudouridine1911/1915/1917 synthase